MRLRKSLASICIVTLSFSIVACSKTSNTVYEETTTQTKEYENLTDHQIAWIADIDGPMRTALSKSAGVNEKISDEERNARLDVIIEKIKNEKLNDSEITYAIYTLMSDIGVAHGGFVPGEGYRTEKENISYPLIGDWFGNEYRIVATLPEYEEHIGKYIVAVNDVPIEEVLNAYDSHINNETESRLKAIFRNVNSTGFNQFELEYTGIIEEDADTVKFTLSDGDTNTEVNVAALTFSNENPINVVSIYDSMEKIPFGLEKYYSLGQSNFCYYFDEENRAMYFQYNECYSEETHGKESGYPNFVQFFDEMISVMKENEDKIDCFVIDVRNNGGGSEMIFNTAANKYKDYLNQYPIKVLMDKDTFSAAVDCIDTTLDTFDNVMLYGEETGLAIHNYTEVKENRLENTGGYLYTTSHIDACRVIDKRAEDTSKGVLPDVEVIQSYENYVSGIDDVYAAAVSK